MVQNTDKISINITSNKDQSMNKIANMTDVNTNNAILEKKTKENKINSIFVDNNDLEFEEDDIIPSNTLKEANEILQKYNKANNTNNKDLIQDEEDEDEDFDDYIKNLENKA